MTIIYTGTPPNIKVNGISFHTGQPVEVPDAMGALLIQKPFFAQQPIADPNPDTEKQSDKRRK